MWNGKACSQQVRDPEAHHKKWIPTLLFLRVCAGCSSSRGLQVPQEPSGMRQWFGADHRGLILPFLQLLAEKWKGKCNQFGMCIFTMSTYKRLTTDLLLHLWQPAYMLASKKCYLEDILQYPESCWKSESIRMTTKVKDLMQGCCHLTHCLRQCSRGQILHAASTKVADSSNTSPACSKGWEV